MELSTHTRFAYSHARLVDLQAQKKSGIIPGSIGARLHIYGVNEAPSAGPVGSTTYFLSCL